jgi:hypothetical protein
VVASVVVASVVVASVVVDADVLAADVLDRDGVAPLSAQPDSNATTNTAERGLFMVVGRLAPGAWFPVWAVRPYLTKTGRIALGHRSNFCDRRCMEMQPDDQPLRRVPARRPLAIMVTACIVLFALGYTLLRIA